MGLLNSRHSKDNFSFGLFSLAFLPVMTAWVFSLSYFLNISFLLPASRTCSMNGKEFFVPYLPPSRIKCYLNSQTARLSSIRSQPRTNQKGESNLGYHSRRLQVYHFLILAMLKKEELVFAYFATSFRLCSLKMRKNITPVLLKTGLHFTLS